jgi:hypothetical protein
LDRSGVPAIEWELQLVHLNHIHMDQFSHKGLTFPLSLSAGSHGGDRYLKYPKNIKNIQEYLDQEISIKYQDILKFTD